MFLENLFSNVLDMSITASYVVIAVIIIRFIIKKAPKSFSFAIWIPVLFRLVCPISFISNLSVFNFINRDSFRKIEGVSQSITVNNTISNIRSGQVSDNIAGNTVTNIANNTTLSQGIGNNFMYLVSILWMIGIQILIVYFIVSYIKTYSRIKTATLYNENVYESDQIDTAFVFGLIKPKIYIPVNLTESEKIYIIEHEKVHIKRKDYVTKIIAFLILIIHWFNPIMWISFILMTRDMEMSCDERVMKNLGEDIKTNYSYSLLNLAVNKGNTFNIPLSFSENNIKSRIENVLNYKKPKKWFILIIALAIVASTVFLISNPKNNDVDNSKSLIQNIQTLKKDSQNRNVLIKNIGDITDFKWDYVYSFEPYTSKENIEKAIGFKSDKIKESVNEGTNQVIFTKGKEVVCYIYGYPDDSVYFDFRSLYNYY
ncbi:MAG: M56 family metallopeptidase, partial [Clostridiales bacterium]|nr:M56 family metallopeptidase [Clostridiales bacterium]